ncbi:MAG: GldG family protein [Chloroflexota bacterium]
MKHRKNIRTYALAALGISILACIAAGVIALMIGLNSVGWFLPRNIETWKQAFWTSLTLIGIGVSVYGILLPDQVRRFLSRRQTRYGSNSVILLLALVGILVMVNFLAYQNPLPPLDMTADKAHTLAPETRQVLENLPGKVTATAYFTSGSSTTQADDLLNNFKSNSNGNFDYRFSDPDADPVAVHNAGITGNGKILLSLGDRQEVASYADETELVRAINRLVHPGVRVVYFLTGHGEVDINTSGDDALSSVKATLEGKNYTVQTLNLLAENQIPADALAIVVMGPLKPLAQAEVDLLGTYLQSGGGLVVGLDPLPLTEFGDTPDPLAAYLASDWGILFDDNIIIDMSNPGNELMAVSESLSSEHPITRGMTQVAILPNSRSLTQGAVPENVNVIALAQTTRDSWGETSYTNMEGTRVQFDEGADLLGPLTLALAGEDGFSGGRVVAFGSASFAVDLNFNAYGNGDLIINAIDWAAQQEDQITLTPYDTTERTLKLINTNTWLAILLFSVFLLPGLVVIAGGVSWFLRRRRG